MFFDSEKSVDKGWNKYQCHVQNLKLWCTVSEHFFHPGRYFHDMFNNIDLYFSPTQVIQTESFGRWQIWTTCSNLKILWFFGFEKRSFW